MPIGHDPCSIRFSDAGIGFSDPIAGDHRD
jgi:hypothetical protein